MTLAATLVLATSLALAATVATLAFAWRSDGHSRRSWIASLAQMLAARGLRNLPAAHRERYREEWAADLAHLKNTPARMLIHALQLAASARDLTRTVGASPPPRRDALYRRALAHLGVPVSLAQSYENANASYVFGGTMRWRPPTAAPTQRTE